jgi:hypothetical protein
VLLRSWIMSAAAAKFSPQGTTVGRFRCRGFFRTFRWRNICDAGFTRLALRFLSLCSVWPAQPSHYPSACCRQSSLRTSNQSSSSTADAIIAGTTTAGGGRDFTGAAMHGVGGSDGVAARAGTAGAGVIARDAWASAAVSDVALASAAASDMVSPFRVVGLGWVEELLG